jgi:hypothetical protein
MFGYCCPRDVVAAALDREFDDVGSVVDHRVPDLSGLVVPLLAGFQHVATEFLPQPFDRAVRSCRA